MEKTVEEETLVNKTIIMKNKFLSSRIWPIIEYETPKGLKPERH
jgi:hypothetical protein